MQDELVHRLMGFGLSVNQAKIYLSIIQSPSLNIKAISTNTKVHRQDIYKILPKLEKMGLIVLTIGHPISIRPIPIEQALNNVIEIKSQKAKQEIKQLKTTVKILVDAIKTQQQNNVEKESIIQAEYLSTDYAIQHQLDAAYANAKTKVDVIINFQILESVSLRASKRFQSLAENGVKTRIILDIPRKKSDLNMLQNIIPRQDDFFIKIVKNETTLKPYIIIDDKNIYVSTKRRTPNQLPCVLHTNSENVISVYRDNFESTWIKAKELPKLFWAT